MGLAAVRRIARAHGGSCEARSVVGKGSVFKLRLPVDTAVSKSQRFRTAKFLKKIFRFYKPFHISGGTNLANDINGETLKINPQI